MKFIFYYIAFILLSTSISAQSGHWEKLKPKNNPGVRWWFEIAPIGENKAIFFGGERNAKGKLNDTWIYDYKKGDWEQIVCKNSPSGRSEYSLTRISKNKVLLFGGEADSIWYFVGKLRGDFWIFDLDSMNWYKIYEDTTNKLLNRYRHKAALLNDSLLLIFAGDYSGFGDLFTNDIYVFNFNNRTVSKNLQIDPTILPREFLQMDRISDNLIFIFGGFTNKGSTDDNFIIDSTYRIKRIRELKNNCIPLSQSGMSHIKEGIFLLFAGAKEIRYDRATWYDSTWIFDYYNKNWTKLDLSYHPIGRLGPGMSIIDTNKILMYGGFIRGAPDTTYYTETWLFTLDSMPTAVPDVNNISEIVIYPNPASDYIEISYPPSEKRGSGGVSIFDLLGMEITTPSNLTPSPSPGGEGSRVRFDVSHLSPGVYFVRFGNDVRKFVKI